MYITLSGAENTLTRPYLQLAGAAQGGSALEWGAPGTAGGSAVEGQAAGDLHSACTASYNFSALPDACMHAAKSAPAAAPYYHADCVGQHRCFANSEDVQAQNLINVKAEH